MYKTWPGLSFLDGASCIPPLFFLIKPSIFTFNNPRHRQNKTVRLTPTNSSNRPTCLSPRGRSKPPLPNPFPGVATLCAAAPPAKDPGLVEASAELQWPRGAQIERDAAASHRGPKATPTCSTRTDWRSKANNALPNSDICKIILAVIFPPLGVFLEVGCGGKLCLNIILTLCGTFPCSTRFAPRLAPGCMHPQNRVRNPCHEPLHSHFTNTS
ncbi:YqaE/Pmp3 family membrane protein [Candidatus Bathyarchaeota archaeon]|nr:YqaE/Pmp3 family membrane protein [Candidatus Bathyarchaeota archaeon]